MRGPDDGLTSAPISSGASQLTIVLTGLKSHDAETVVAQASWSGLRVIASSSAADRILSTHLFLPDGREWGWTDTASRLGLSGLVRVEARFSSTPGSLPSASILHRELDACEHVTQSRKLCGELRALSNSSDLDNRIKSAVLRAETMLVDQRAKYALMVATIDALADGRLGPSSPAASSSP